MPRRGSRSEINKICMTELRQSYVHTSYALPICLPWWLICTKQVVRKDSQMPCRTHFFFNLQQDVIVAVCSSPSLHLSEMGMAPSTARCNRRCLFIAIVYVKAQPLTAGCNRYCRLFFYGSGKGASVGERPTRVHFLAIFGEKPSVHSTVRLRFLLWI